VVVAVIVVAVMDLAVIVLHVAVMDLFWGRHRLWPSLLWPSLFVAVMDLAVIVFHMAVMVCGRYSRSPLGGAAVWATDFIYLFIYHMCTVKKVKK